MAGDTIHGMNELDRSECNNTSGFHTSPTLGLLEYYPSPSDESERRPGECPSYFLLPNDSLRIKYLEERKKLWKQLTADFCDSDNDSDGDGEESQCQIPLEVSLPSGNIPPTNDEPETEVKVLPEEVTTTFASNSGSNHVLPAAPRHEIMKMHSTEKQAYQQGTSGNIPLRNNPSFAVGNPRQPYTPYLASRQLTSFPPSDFATAQLQDPDNASEMVEVKKKRRSHYKSWGKKFDQRFEELKEYKKKHGHCNAPRIRSGPGSDLGLWVSKTRQACNKFISSGKSSPGLYMDDDRMQRLKELGFELSMTEVDKDTRQTSVFARRLREVKDFRNIHGHTNVPTTGSFMSLGRWCSSVKRACRDFEAGRVRSSTIKITRKRWEMLKAIEFDWEPQKRHRTFEERIVELKEFKDLHGHFSVPASGKGKALGNWYQYVKRDYYKTIAASQSMDMKGMKSNRKIDHVKQKRFEILTEMGMFDGVVPMLPGVPSDDEERIISEEEETKMYAPLQNNHWQKYT